MPENETPESRTTPPPLPPRWARKIPRHLVRGQGTAAAKPPPLPPPKQRPFSTDLLDQQDLDRYRNLLVFAKATVEGYFAGKHKSPDFGSNAEFAEHRQYLPGDEVAHVDWKVYARSKRLFTRRFEDETDMVVYLLADVSGSMAYRGEGHDAKFTRAARIAAALAYLMLRQGDKVSLTLFSDRVRTHCPPGGTRRHLYDLIRELERLSDRATGATRIADSIRDCAPMFKKRGRIVLLSDFLGEEPDDVFDALGQFVHRKFDILLLQVIDPDELTLPQVDIARFVDMESGEEVQVEPATIRHAYEEQVRERIESITEQANRRAIQHSVLSTRAPYIEAVEAWLGFRSWSRL